MQIGTFDVNGETITIGTTTYQSSGLLCIMLTCNGGIPFGKLSVNLPGWENKLENENQFFAKTWSENRFFADKLRDSKWFKDTGKRYRLNHVIVEVWELITEKGEKTMAKKTANKKQTMPKINLTIRRKRELRDYAINTIIKSLRKKGDLDDFIDLLQNYKIGVVKDLKSNFPESDMKVLEKYDARYIRILTIFKELPLKTKQSFEMNKCHLVNNLIDNLRDFVQFETPLIIPRKWSIYDSFFDSLSEKTLELKTNVEEMLDEIYDIIVDELCPYDQLINSKRTLNGLNQVWPEAAKHFKDIWLDRIKEETKNESGQCKRMSEEAIAKKIAEHQKLLK